MSKKINEKIDEIDEILKRDDLNEILNTFEIKFLNLSRDILDNYKDDIIDVQNNLNNGNTLENISKLLPLDIF